MDYNGRKLVPYIPPAEYDKVAYEFLEQFYPDALKNPMPVPIIITSPFFLSYPMTTLLFNGCTILIISYDPFQRQ